SSPSFHPTAQTVRTATRTTISDLSFYTTLSSKQANVNIRQMQRVWWTILALPVLGHFLKDVNIVGTRHILKY
ncbi:hypothetical protein L873DRAFT_1801435, partial [Choiromyces venosus 120613-1]